MTEAEARAKEEELSELSQRVQIFRQTAAQDLQKKQQELITPVLQKVQAAVQQVGVNNGFTFIFERSGSAGLIVYNGQKSIDITPLVKKQLGIN